MIHGHGDDQYRYDFPILHNFSSNVWHDGMDNSLLQHLQQSLAEAGKYPDPNADALAAEAARHHGLEPENCLFTNGATEAFYLIAHLFSGQSATIFTPTFAEYEDACRIHGLDLHFKPRSAVASASVQTPLAFICNPNNPDGQTNSLQELAMLITRHPATTFVIDEAYHDFALAAPSCLSLLKQHHNLMIVKSLTKLFCIPGLRVGYLLCHPEVKQPLQAKKMPWSVNSLAIAAGHYIFDHYDQLKPDMQTTLEAAKVLQRAIQELSGFEVIPSVTTYFLVKLKKGKAADLKAYLAGEHRILLRDATNFRGLEGEWVRIATQSSEKNSILLSALRQWSRHISS